MSKLVKTLYLALGLLLSQAASAVHDIHCLEEVHAQSCEICSVNDHSACDVASRNTLECISYAEDPEAATTPVATPRCGLLYLSRGPPR